MASIVRGVARVKGAEKAEEDGYSIGSLVEARRLKNWVAKGLGVLWILDGLLQLQPPMFSQSLTYSVIANADMSLPSSLYYDSIKFLVRFVAPNIALFNGLAAALQLALGMAILAGRGRALRLGLAASVTWGLAVWVFGEGMGGFLGPTMTGGIFPGTPSIMNGFPGAALVYALIAVLLLLPDSHWRLGGRLSLVRDAPALLFLLCAAVQAAPLMWASYGQASIFAPNTANFPDVISNVMIVPLLTFTIANPALSNGLELAACLLCAVGLLARQKWGYVFALAWLAFIWWFALGLGGILTGSSTDPNTPPAIALLMVPAISAARRKKREKAEASPAAG